VQDECRGVRWTRDGRGLLVSCLVGEQHHLEQRDLDGRLVAQLGAGTDQDDCGDAIALVDGPQLVLRDPRTLVDSVLVRQKGGGIAGARCSPDGRHVAYISGVFTVPFSGDVIVVDREGHERALTSDRTASSVTFATDESVLVSRNVNGKVNLFETDLEGAVWHQVTFGDGPDFGPDVGRDGRTVLFERDESNAVVFSVDETGLGKRITPGFETFDRIEAEAPDRRTLLATRTHDAHTSDGAEMFAIDVATGHASSLGTGR
jgi:hypothetical protein